jgi:hypothetical protein
MSELDVELQDNELIAEIALVAELMVMATEAPGVLDQPTIDRVLGVAPQSQIF